MTGFVILKVLRHPHRVALEYEIVEPVVNGYQPHHPQTFANEAGDDRCTWANLRSQLPPGASDLDCIKKAKELLEQEVKEREGRALEDAELNDPLAGVLAPEVKP